MKKSGLGKRSLFSLEKKDGFYTITINRPSKLNSMTLEMLDLISIPRGSKTRLRDQSSISREQETGHSAQEQTYPVPNPDNYRLQESQRNWAQSIHENTGSPKTSNRSHKRLLSRRRKRANHVL